MAEQKSETGAGDAALSFPQKHYFLIRRLHSLSGLVPLGVFVFVHLLTNSTILIGKEGAEFQAEVERIHSLRGLLLPVEIFGIFLPLLFHTLVGIAISFTATSNWQQYPYNANVRYWLQRGTAYIALVFILFHLYQMHWLGSRVGGGAFQLHGAGDMPAAADTTARAIQSAWWIVPFYAVGIIATVFHLANGIWTALITWGITIRPGSQRISGYICAGFGIIVGAMGLGALAGFKTFPTPRGAVESVKMQHVANSE